MTLTSTPAWQTLAAHRDEVVVTKLSDLLRDSARINRYSQSLGGLTYTYAFQKATDKTLSLLINLAEQQKLGDWRARMFGGEKINATENRAVLHTALRRTDDSPILVDSQDVMPEIRATQNRTAAFVDDVRKGSWTGVGGKTFRTVVNIGIGGSDLGPRLAVRALRPYSQGIETRFAANVDSFEMQDILRNADPAQTLFVVVSKTFTTQETLMNAKAAREWIVEKLGPSAVSRHFVAVSANAGEVANFGIHADNLFPMWDWVGGRYSLWSAVGLSLALAIGNENFRDLLAGAQAMDAHFLSAPMDKNIPVLMALLGIWNRNFLDAPALAILPYDERLRELPRYLQQLEMESNGKSVARDGTPVDYATVPAIFGDCGTVAQHSFMQALHQGTASIPADFIAVTENAKDSSSRRALLSNLAAQIGALAFGHTNASLPQDVYPGDRPSNLITLEKLDPYRLGLLLALYEHKVFTQGAIWNVNSFDQPGVQLGKSMANDLEKGSAQKEAPAAVAELFKALIA